MVKDNRSIGYDNISQIYDVSRAANAETVEKLVRLLHASSDSVLLDLGCGTGNYTASLQQVAKSVVGIDMSIGMIERAQAKSPLLQFICADVTNLPFDSETFDGALAIQVLHHVKSKEIFLTEAHRVLRKDAYIAIHSCSHRQMRAFWFYHYFPEGIEKDIKRTPDAGGIASLLEGTGFSNIGIEICYHDLVVAHETPERYLDKNYRDGISTFALLTKDEVELGCEKLEEDIASGAVGNIVHKYQAKVATVGGSSIIYGRKN
jgi:ubiquinone/menaquinone biosynthesis C-methylase UbiE